MMKILLILEGERTESDFFQSILEKFDLKAELFVVGTNLYTLYHKCSLYNFECDVKDVLKELVNDNATQAILDQKFAYTYLVFDADLHHKKPEQRNKEISITDLLENNFPELIEMAQHFSDETDPTIGRLYINYPMMESFRYCNSFNDNNYLSTYISISDIKSFKQLASQKNLSGLSIDKYNKMNFIDLICLNIRKTNILMNGDNENFPTYEIYQNISKAELIAENQLALSKTSKKLSIINTSLFIIPDYFGNKNNFYNDNFLLNGDK